MRRDTFYSEECKLYNVDRDQNITAEVVQFKPNDLLVCSIQGAVEIRMNYTKHGEYVGSKAGMEFKTQGPTVL
jgi:hypothetical protein